MAGASERLESAAERRDYLERNREAWSRWSTRSAISGAKAWQSDGLRWGLWDTPEAALRLLEGLAPGADVIELGCGAGALCAWLKRAEHRPVGIDFTPLQVKVAERLQLEQGVSFPLVQANAEDVPFDGESFDMAISEYGASVWCDPRHWLPEAWRLLRPNGTLVFFTTGALMTACTPDDGGRPGEKLVRDYFTSFRVEFGEEDGVEFHPTHGQWIQQLRAAGFSVEELTEVRPPKGANARYDIVDPTWARRWPSEEIWVARKPATHSESERWRDERPSDLSQSRPLSTPSSSDRATEASGG